MLVIMNTDSSVDMAVCLTYSRAPKRLGRVEDGIESFCRVTASRVTSSLEVGARSSGIDANNAIIDLIGSEIPYQEQRGIGEKGCGTEHRWLRRNWIFDWEVYAR